MAHVREQWPLNPALIDCNRIRFYRLHQRIHDGNPIRTALQPGFWQCLCHMMSFVVFCFEGNIRILTCLLIFTTELFVIIAGSKLYIAVDVDVLKLMYIYGYTHTCIYISTLLCCFCHTHLHFEWGLIDLPKISLNSYQVMAACLMKSWHSNRPGKKMHFSV